MKTRELWRLIDLKLVKLDNELAKRKQQEIYILYLLPVLLLGYIASQIIIPNGLTMIDDKQREMVEVDTQLNEYRARVKTLRDGYEILKILKQQNRKKAVEIETINNENLVIDEKISIELAKMKYNSISWSEYLSTITKEATKEDVVLKVFTNAINPDLRYSTFAKILDVDINASAGYSSIMSFLDKLETDESISEVTELKMKLDKDIDMQAHIELWGTK
ncbi:MAG: hypothetical protein ACTTIC_04635 [Helicobacteraceae bacterium]